MDWNRTIEEFEARALVVLDVRIEHGAVSLADVVAVSGLGIAIVENGVKIAFNSADVELMSKNLVVHGIRNRKNHLVKTEVLRLEIVSCADYGALVTSTFVRIDFNGSSTALEEIQKGLRMSRGIVNVDLSDIQVLPPALYRI